jgi:hypothetical protein
MIRPFFKPSNNIKGCNLMANTRLNFNVSKRRESKKLIIVVHFEGLERPIRAHFLNIHGHSCNLFPPESSNLIYFMLFMPTDDCISASVGRNVHFERSPFSLCMKRQSCLCSLPEPLIRCLSKQRIDSKRRNHGKI